MKELRLKVPLLSLSFSISLSLSLSLSHTNTLFYILQPWANFNRRYLEFLKIVLRMGIKAKSKAHEAN